MRQQLIRPDHAQALGMKAAMRYVAGERQSYLTPYESEFDDDLGPRLCVGLMLVVAFALVLWGAEFGAWFDRLWAVQP